MTPSEISRVVDVNLSKRIHFVRMAIFSSTGLLIALVEFRPFTTMSEVKVNHWDDVSQFFFFKRRFTNPIATNGALLEGFMFAIGWHKFSMKEEQFGLLGSLGKIEHTKYEWQNQGANLNSVPNNASHFFLRGGLLKISHTGAGSKRFTRKSFDNLVGHLQNLFAPLLVIITKARVAGQDGDIQRRGEGKLGTGKQ
ncbi:hypothetical protein O181_020595 [Austropuccinia psidii MF-1]|uniref:Tet-like 2OG-Fe(II) oxygenase domain-containing protein n=1 Tax=Austropuccinia psidii MF-1 TaxID=1389203 RepID=A0A9Q3GW91_9BASI|nr:hypothetical protein [Austropuccinia psidii MF-1]